MKNRKVGWWGIILGGGLGFLAYWKWSEKAAEPKAMLPATAGSKRDFVTKMLAAISGMLASNFSDSGRALVIAWAAFETDWGRTSGWTKGNNAFNITAGSAWKGDTVPGPDTEYDSQGNVKNITQAWRKYPTLSESIADMMTFIGQARFGNGRIKLIAGDSSFSDELYKGKYFTLPPEKYRAGVEATLALVKPLIPIVPPVSTVGDELKGTGDENVS